MGIDGNMISVIIPSYHEEDITRCLESVNKAIDLCPCSVEVRVVKDVKGIGIARNRGALNSTGDVLLFLDSDCTISENFLKEVYERSLVFDNLGGGTKYVRFDKYSISRMLFLIWMLIPLLICQVSIGAFWVKRGVFNMLDGFREDYDLILDFDFALRLKRLAGKMGCQFRSIKNKENYMVWSTRSWDKYGEWFWIKKYRLHQN